MRILLISHTCQSETEGQPKAKLLSEMPGIDLRVVIPDRWKHYGTWRSPLTSETHKSFCKVEKVMWPWLGPAQWYLHWYPRIANILKEFKPDIIDLWEEPWGLVSAHTCWLRNRILPKAKIISETEQNLRKSLPFPFEQFRTYTLRNADLVIGRSQEAVEIVRSQGYKGPAKTVPNGVDANLFRPLNKEACKRELGLNGFIVGYVGRIVEEKGLMDLVESIAFCAQDVNLLFAGSGPFKQNLIAKLARMGKVNQARFLPNQQVVDLPRIMNAINVLALPSRTTPSWKEQFGRVIIEAQACQTPVIGSDSGAIPEVIGNAGLVIPERNPEALANAIKQLYADLELRKELGLIGREQVERNYSWERVAERMREIYLSFSKKTISKS